MRTSPARNRFIQPTPTISSVTTTTGSGQCDFNPIWTAVKKDLNAAGYRRTTRVHPGRLDLDHLSLYDGSRAVLPGGHASNMGQLLDVAYNIEYGQRDRAAELAEHRVPARIFARSGQLFDLSAPQTSAITSSAATSAAASGRSSAGFGHCAAKHRIDRHGAQRGRHLTLTLRSGSVTTSRVFDRVIMRFLSLFSGRSHVRCGVPCRGLRQPQADGVNTARLRQRTPSCNLQFDTRYWNTSGPWGIGNGATYSDTGYQNTWEVSRAQDGSTGILVDYTGGGVPLASFSGDPTNQALVKQYAKTFLSQLEPVFPGITSRWNGRATLDVRSIIHSYGARTRTGRSASNTVQRLREGAAAGPDERQVPLWRASTTSQDFQGFMEGGAAEGARAAQRDPERLQSRHPAVELRSRCEFVTGGHCDADIYFVAAIDRQGAKAIKDSPKRRDAAAKAIESLGAS